MTFIEANKVRVWRTLSSFNFKTISWNSLITEMHVPCKPETLKIEKNWTLLRGGSCL